MSLEQLPNELLLNIASYLDKADMQSLGLTQNRINSLFFKPTLLYKFLQRVAYGDQDKVEELLSVVFNDNQQKIQGALCHHGVFTDYSGREFNCTAYEYAYWAKDTHMCRMLEHYMDEKTKAYLLARIDANDTVGLSYQQNGEKHSSAHFDLTPLKTALQDYVTGFDAWYAVRDMAAMQAAWMIVGKAQRDVPAHIAQEYCMKGRYFFPVPQFNQVSLQRCLTFFNFITSTTGFWFPLGSSDSGLGFGFAIVSRPQYMMSSLGVSDATPECAAADLAAIILLDKVRAADLAISKANLNSPVGALGISV